MNGPPESPDDAALVGAAIVGVENAFTELMRRHKGTVYRFIRRYVGDHDDAHDLLQETFVSAWAALSGFDVNKPLSAWLRRIALNKCRDWSRRRKVRAFFYTARAIETSSKALSAPVVSEDREQEAMLSALDAALAALPRTLKEPLLLTAFEGLSHKQAANLLNVSSKAIETRIYRARQILAREILNQSSPRSGEAPKLEPRP